jgi:hypothetical protein
MHSLVIAYYLVLWPYSNMTETSYDLQNIIVIPVKMRGLGFGLL